MGPCGYGTRLVLSSPRMSVVGVVVVFRFSTHMLWVYVELKDYREKDPHHSDDAHLGLRAI
jgi:hypothetical protein